MRVPNAMKKYVREVLKKLSTEEFQNMTKATHKKLCKMYKKCFYSTWKSAIRPCRDGTFFVLTGDIPAMWLRDSAAQVDHYVELAQDAKVATVLEGIIRRQLSYISIDPYANAFNKTPNGHGHVTDIPKPGPWVFERKYEIDSLCYPIRLLYRYWKKTGRDEIIRDSLVSTVQIILKVWRTEQHHLEKSEYRFTRPKPGKPWSTIYNDGLGNPVCYTGMTWSGFRPSDDGCEYGYLISSNMFAVVTLENMAEMLEEVCHDDALAEECRALKNEIDRGIREHGIQKNPTYGEMYVCETDGFAHHTFLDDANIPSLLSAPYIGYLDADDPIYINTREFLLSRDNPYYFSGKYAKGIGSRHTPKGHIWHMALIMQGLTGTDKKEQEEILHMLLTTDAGKNVMHESFHADDPKKFTRKWFTWPNALFVEFINKVFKVSC